MQYRIFPLIFLITATPIFYPNLAQADTALNVLLYRQEKPLTCEASALNMALNFKGFPVTESQLVTIIGHDPRARRGNVWGDPDVGYVGSLHGTQNTTGYGVHWDPIARAAQVFLPNSAAFRGWSVQDLTRELQNGNPVIVWGVQGRKVRQDGWYTFDGRFVGTWMGEHTRVVIGFTGNPSNPTSFILNDPWYGRLHWTRAHFERNWTTFGNSGVVIR